MSKLHFYVSAVLLLSLALDPVLAQNRRGGAGNSSSSPGTQRREAPRPSTVPSRPAPSEPRQTRPAPSEPRQTRPAPSEPRQTRPAPSEPRQPNPMPTSPTPRQVDPPSNPRPSRGSDNGSGTVRREAPTPNVPSRQSSTEPRTGQENPRRGNQTPNSGTVQPRPRDGAPSRTVRRDVNPSTVIRRGVSVERRPVYGTSNYHNPYGHNHIHSTTIHHHVPYSIIHRHRIVLTPTIYYSHLYRNAQSCYYYDWLFCYTSRANGYYIIDDYPFYVYNGYYHRYSSFDTCNYQLVDTNTRRVVQNYWNLTCNRSYDQCSLERDYRNFRENFNRFACAETYRNQNYAYFNTFNEQDYYVGGYNDSTADTYYENDYRAPDYDSLYTPANSQGSMPNSQDNSTQGEDNLPPEEVSPVLGSMSDLGSPRSGNASPIPVRRERDTQDY